MSEIDPQTSRVDAGSAGGDARSVVEVVRGMFARFGITPSESELEGFATLFEAYEDRRGALYKVPGSTPHLEADEADGAR